MIDSAIQRHLMENVMDTTFAVSNNRFEFFKDLVVPVVHADNDFDFLIEMTKKMMKIIGASVGSELMSLIYLSGAKYHFSYCNPAEIYSSESYSIDPKEVTPSVSSPVSDEFYDQIIRYGERYSAFIEEKWSILGTIVQLNLEKHSYSNYYCALLNQNMAVPLLYEFLCAVYDEALDAEKEDVILEVMQLASLHADMYPHFMGFHDLLGVAHYNRGEYEHSIRRWNLAKECIVKFGDEADHTQFESKIDSMIANSQVKLSLKLGCDNAEADPDLALRHFALVKPVYSDWWVYNYYRGLALLKKGELGKADRCFQRTLELFSGCHHALERQAEIYERRDDYEKAYEALSHSLKINPSNGETLGRLILVADRVGKLDKVARLIKQAKEFDSENEYVIRADQLIHKKTTSKKRGSGGSRGRRKKMSASEEEQ